MHMGLKDIRIEDYRYDLPQDRIAVHPVADRDRSNLLVYRNGAISGANFSDLPELLPEDSMVVRNDTRVIPARIAFTKATGARIEVFLLEPIDPPGYTRIFSQTVSCSWSVTIGNMKKWKSGELTWRIETAEGMITLVASRDAVNDPNVVNFTWTPETLSFAEILHLFGKTPIPPYLGRESEDSDKDRYQTVYAHFDGSVAAPTAGLHFTDRLIQKLTARRISFQSLTLHVGSGTFVPVKSERIGDHSMHAETVFIHRQLIQSLLEMPTSRVTLVGTTSLRSLESLYWLGCKLMRQPESSVDSLAVDQWDPYEMPEEIPLADSLRIILDYLTRNNLETLHFNTRLIIVPGYRIRTTRRLITNFHQPSSTLLLLVAALVGERWKDIYDYALRNGFRFLSYGDSSLLDMNPGPADE
jgi:S-adenosylmethionine:tRNA ribosyltransferase-isomerase